MAAYKLVETGLKDLDSQHEKLISAMNELHEAIGSITARPVLEKVVKELSYYSLSHLAYEEQGMEIYGYPELEAHLEQHDIFREKLDKIIDKVNADAPLVAIEAVVFLRDWFLNHIATEDVKYASFYKNK